jgi:Flp pilus assembly protein TadD
MRTISVLCSVLAVFVGCSGVKTYIGQDSQQSTIAGKQWLDQQRYDEAIAAYRQAVRLEPQNALAHYGLGVAYSRKGENEQAIAAYREAIRLQPEHADAHYGLGVASGHLSQNEQAVTAYREAIRLNPGLADAHYNLGMIYARLRLEEQAIAAFREAIRLQPTDALAHYGLGVIYAKRGQNDQAMEVYREAIRLNPNHAEAYTGLGVIYSRTRQDDQAIEAYRQAVQLKPSQPNAYYGLWGMYRVKGDRSEAQRAWRAYQALVPGAGPEPDTGMAQAEPQAPSTPTAVELVAERPTIEPVSLPTVSPPLASSLPLPEPPRVMPERSAEAMPKPSPMAVLSESPTAPSPPRPSISPARPPEVGGLTFPSSEQRTALVIGNAAYRVDPLRNAVHDATDMAMSLRGVGFQVIELHDADHQRMEEGVEQFTRQLGRGGVGVFYYSGHGVQVNGLNYLIPVDARISRESDIKYQSVQVDWVLDRMRDAGNELNVIILDACRNNPYTRNLRSSQPGLAVIQAASGSLIAYATSPGTTAEDGPGRNGTYTKHLLHFMQVPSLSAEQMFKEVRVAVAQETGKKQIPWVSTSILGDFYFAGRYAAWMRLLAGIVT